MCLERDAGLCDILPWGGEEGTRHQTRKGEEGTKGLVQHRNYPTITRLVLGSVILITEYTWGCYRLYRDLVKEWSLYSFE